MLEVYEFSLSYQATVWTSVVPLSNGLTIVWKAINQAYAAYAGKNVDGESGASKVEHNEKKG